MAFLFIGFVLKLSWQGLRPPASNDVANPPLERMWQVYQRFWLRYSRFALRLGTVLMVSGLVGLVVMGVARLL